MDKTSNFTSHVQDLQLTKKDRAQLIDILNSYNEDKSVGRLVKKLIYLLQPVEYLALLKDIRNSICQKHAAQFDKMIKTYLFRSLPPQTGPNDHRKTYSSATLPIKQSLTWSNNGNHSNYIKTPSCKFYVVQFDQDPSHFINFGMFLCDKLENRTGIKVGAVSKVSPAYRHGIRAGDYLIEMNGISLEKMPLKTVLKILPTLASMRFIIRRHGNPGKIGLTSINPWTKEKMYPTMTSTHGSVSYASLEKSYSFNRNRRILPLSRSSCSSPIGFTIRGGSDYGTSIFVSSVDQGSLAEHVGLKIGDCIVEVNGTSFRNIFHDDAAQFIKCHLAMELKIESTGGIPGSINSNSYSTLPRRGNDSISSVGKEDLAKSLQDLQISTSQDKDMFSSTPHYKINGSVSASRSPSRQSHPYERVTTREENSKIRWRSTGDLTRTEIETNESDDEHYYEMIDTLRFEDRWKGILTVNEYNKLKLLLANYKKNKNVEEIVVVVIKDFPINKRLEILNDIRELIREEHIDRFDEVVRMQLERNQFKKLSYKNSMPASLSKLWFYQSDGMEKEPQSIEGESPIDFVKPPSFQTQIDLHDSGVSSVDRSGSEFREFSFGTWTNRRHISHEKEWRDVEKFTDDVNYDHRSKRPDVRQKAGSTKGTRKHKSTMKNSNITHDPDLDFMSSDSTFNENSNWVLKRGGDVSKQFDQNSTPVPGVNNFFPTVADDHHHTVDIESDFSWPDAPEQNNNSAINITSPSDVNRIEKSRFKNSDTEPSYASFLGNSVNETTSAGKLKKQERKDQHQYEVQVTSSSDKKLYVTDDINKYAIQPVGPSMTIKSVTVHRNNAS